MNRLALVPCLVVASYVAGASYIAWPIVVYNLGGSRVGLSIPNSVANHGESRKDYSPPTEQTSSALPSYEVPNPVAIPEKPAHAVSPGTNYHESIWVTVLLPARVHTGPSVDTPITHFYAVGTPLHATRYWNDWIEVIEPGASKSGWSSLLQLSIQRLLRRLRPLMAVSGHGKPCWRVREILTVA